MTRASRLASNGRRAVSSFSGSSGGGGGSSSSSSSSSGSGKWAGSALDGHFHAEANLLAKTVQLITSYRRWGHLVARTDPLELSKRNDMPQSLRLERYGFSSAQLSSAKPLDVSKAVINPGGFTSPGRSLPLSELHTRLQEVYAGSVGVEFMHIQCEEERGWLRDQLETVKAPVPSADEQLHTLKHLCWADSFAAFCGSNFRLAKRFGLEGCESLVVGMQEAVVRSGELGVEHIVLGMAHRGRLNVLANVARKPLDQIFRDFRGVIQGSPIDIGAWRATTQVVFERFDWDRDGELSVEELHPALLRLGVPASVDDAASLVREWAAEPAQAGVRLEQFQQLTRGLLLPRSMSGDVKYHLGTVVRRELRGGRALQLEVMPNPSHLEAVNPLVSGRARAVQQRMELEEAAAATRARAREEAAKEEPDADADADADSEARASARASARRRCLPMVVHGDAAFAAQGVVYETLGLSRLDGYGCGGVVHVIINNQIGFTTPPSQARSSRYCSDVAKVVEAPIFHVNGDDVEAVVRVCRLAVEYRQRFGRDVVVDLVCYRKNGHQEADNPSFTQPAMYERIRRQASTLAQYTAALVARGVTSPEAVEAVRGDIHAVLDGALRRSKASPAAEVAEVAAGDAGGATTTAPPQQQQQPWHREAIDEVDEEVDLEIEDARDADATGVAIDALQAAARACTALPDDETLRAHRVVRRVYEQRAGMTAAPQTAVDWAMAEALACATLLADGVSVRISGQDAERGTFSHRHAVVHDQRPERDGAAYVPLAEVARRAAHSRVVGGGGGAASGVSFEVHNSPLSEAAVLGFELGHSLNNPDWLVLWEAQFGDFANTAQCVIDQFVAAGEAKWQAQSGLVMLLPHGMEGGGPEHSSARLERFLQLCDDDERVIPAVTSERALRRARRTAANMLVANLTTPANYFHALRRQHAHAALRKPLVLMAPKGLLRDKLLSSPLSAFGPGTVFEPVLGEPRPELLPAASEVRKLVLCSGRVYFDLAAAREARGAYDVSIVRVEQLSPFPYHEVRAAIARLPNATVAWAQEEAMNYGAWSYVRPRLENTVRSLSGLNYPIPYIGRSPSAAPATGVVELHKQQLDELLEVAFR